MEIKECNCDERFMVVDGKHERLLTPEHAPAGGQSFYHYHDCGYIRQRNALIPQAELSANNIAGFHDPYHWTRIFVQEMDRLCREKVR